MRVHMFTWTTKNCKEPSIYFGLNILYLKKFHVQHIL